MKRPREKEKEGGAATATTSDGHQQANTKNGKRPAPVATAAAAAAAAAAGGGRPSPRLFVGGLHKTVKEGDILRKFVAHGRVVKEEYPFHMHGPRKGEPRGYAFVEYETTAEAAAAMAALDGTAFKGRRLQVRFVREQEALPTDPRAFWGKAKRGARVAAVDGSSSFRGSLGGGKRGKESEESALDAKIRALKAMLQQK